MPKPHKRINCIAESCINLASCPVRRDVFHALRTAMMLTALLCGCAVGPDFQRPDTPVPGQWIGAVPPDASMAAAHGPVDENELAQWWTVFNDPILSDLIQQAAIANLDLKLAEARVRQARASKAAAAGGLGPTLDASGSYARSRNAVTTTGGRTESFTRDQYQAGFDAGWEIDIFGGRRRNLEAAEADLQAAVESLRDVRVSLLAETAHNYIQLRAYQQQIAITQKDLAAQQHSARLTRERFEGGLVSGLDVANAEALTATTAAQVPLLESSARQAIYRLGILVGQPPAALAARLSPAGEIPTAMPTVPVGVPSDLLRRRPDIRLAEARIHAATARIGVAVADLFPRFTLTGAVGYQSAEPGSLFDRANHFWSFGPSVIWRLFESGSRQAAVNVQEALQEQELLTYRQTVLNGLQEVENALVAAVKEQAHQQALAAAVTANRKAVTLAEQLYTEGLTDFINVLQAQQALFSTENALVQSIAAVSTDLVALYKALGGGWQATLPEPDPIPPDR